MAEQHLTFRIGSAFSGEGFERAKNVVSDMNREIKISRLSMINISSALAGMDDSAAKAMKALTGLMNAFTSLNPVMLGITAATTALSWAIGECNRYQEEAKKKADALRESVSQLKNDLGSGFIAKVVSELDEVSKKFDTVTKNANQLSAAIAGLNSVNANGAIVDLEVKKIQESFNALDENARRISDSFYDVEIASQKLKNAEELAARKNEDAAKAVSDAEDRITNNGVAVKKLTDRIGELDRQYESNYGDDKRCGEITKERANIMEKINALQTEEEGLRNNLKIAIANEAKVKEEQRQAVEKANADYQALEQKHVALVEEIEGEQAAIKERAEAEREQAELDAQIAADKEAERQAIEDEKKSLQEATEARRKAIDIQKDLNSAANDLRKAEQDYANALNSYAKNFSRVNAMKGIANGTIGNAEEDKKSYKEAGKAAENAAIANGVRTSRELKEIGKQAERADRDARHSREANEMRRDDRELARLEGTNPKLRTKSQEEQLERLRNLKKAREDDINKQEKAKEELNNQKDKIANIDQNLKDIKEKLEKLGCD